MDEQKLRASLEQSYPQDVYNTDEMCAHFNAIGFSAPFVVVTRKSDGAKGSLEFIHSPRFYFNFVKD